MQSVGVDPHPAVPHGCVDDRMREGHRREYAASRDRGSISFRKRSDSAFPDLGGYRCVSFRDEGETYLGGHSDTTRRTGA